MKILIINCVPENIGDRALVLAAYHNIISRLPGAEVIFCVNNLKAGEKFLEGCEVHLDYQYLSSGFFYKAGLALIRRCPVLKIRKFLYEVQKIIFSKRLSSLYLLLDRADLVLSAPGGYLHDYYVTEHRIQFFRDVLKQSKKLVLLPQSIGPLQRGPLAEDIMSIDSGCLHIMVRDGRSYDNIKALGMESARLILGIDLGFAWYDLFNLERKETQDGLIGLCFRDWIHDDEANDIIIGRGSKLAEKILNEDSGKKILFISTCQALEGYRDDSIIAQNIVSKLPKKLQSRCEVSKKQWKNIPEIIQDLSKLDAFLGMRLHGCILSLCAGTPAFGIGYEYKTEEIFGQLGFDKYNCRYDAPLDEWDLKIQRFWRDRNKIRDSIDDTLTRASRDAENWTDVLKTEKA